jgi:AraC-like DNA-binding protein
MRHTSRVTSAVIEVVALRRAEVVLRKTTYKDVIVDERVLTKAYPWKAPPSRLQVIVLLSGGGGGSSLACQDVALQKRGETLLLSPELQAQTRFESTSFVEIEWTTNDAKSKSVEIPKALSSLTEAQVARLERLDELRDADEAKERELYEEAFAILRTTGAPLELDARTLTTNDGPTERDERIARAIEAQMSSLGTSADARSLGELADLSPRQLQRVMTEFASRYGINAGAWRDMRNRWRIQIAVVLLSVPDASVADIAAEVGYRSAPALARAFAAAGFPPPTELRRQLLLPRANEPEITES